MTVAKVVQNRESFHSKTYIGKGKIQEVKELVENAIDAGATAVAVEIRDGGISFLRVTDNGSGIEREQVRAGCNILNSLHNLLNLPGGMADL